MKCCDLWNRGHRWGCDGREPELCVEHKHFGPCPWCSMHGERLTRALTGMAWTVACTLFNRWHSPDSWSFDDMGTDDAWQVECIASLPSPADLAAQLLGEP